MITNVTKNDIRIFLCKPNKDILGEITVFNNPKHKPSLGKVNQLDFSLPLYENDEIGELDNKKVLANKYFNLIRERYLLKVLWLGREEWYIVDDITKTASFDGMEKNITAYSLQYELRGERLFDWDGVLIEGEYRKESLSIQQILHGILMNVAWDIDYIDTELYGIYRRFDYSDNSTVLEALYDIADVFGAIIEWNTHTRTLSFYHDSKYGNDKNILLSYKNYLKTIQDEVKPNDIITRIIPVGKDGIQINSLNPTGSPYLQDFSYFMQPFELDENGNIISSSYWLSDDLCLAILDYNQLTATKQAEYEDLLEVRSGIINERALKESEIFHVQTELRVVRDTIDVKQSQNEDASAELNQEEQLVSQLSQLNDQKEAIENRLYNNFSLLQDITQQLAFESNFTVEQRNELTPFINTAVWENSNIFTEEDLLEAGKEYFSTVNYSNVHLKIGLVDFMNMIEPDAKIKNIQLGDKVNIYFEPFKINVQSQIFEMDIDYESGSVQLEIANTKDIFSDDNERLHSVIYENSAVAGAVLRDKHKWDRVTHVDSTISNFLNNFLDAANQEIRAGVNQSVIINERGITLSNSNDLLRYIRMTNSVIGLVKNGKDVSVAISPEGIAAPLLIGKAIVGENLTIGDDEGTFEINGNLLTIKDREEIVRLLLGEYDDNKFGLKLMNKAGNQVVLDEDGILQTWQEGRTDNVDSSNGLSLYVYLPDDTISIRQAILNFKLLPFRSYGRGTEAGGSSTQTSSSGGGTTATSSSGGGSTQTSSSGGGTSTTSGSGGGTSTSTQNGGGSSETSNQANGFPSTTVAYLTGVAIPDGTTHRHGVTISMSDFSHWHTVSIPSHSHSFSVPNHTHSITIDSHTHSITIPNHQHTVTIPNHAHTVQIPAHSHDIEHGIYTSTSATGVGIIINGVNRTTVLGGKFNSDRNNINITNYLQIGQWNEIRLTSDQLGRIDANVFVQTFMGV